ncbi:MAG: PEP/pyruvate-binding domain-containing protein [Rudaea sp.]
MPDWILTFQSNETDLARAGGKGTNLAALARAGQNVPPGFIVSTAAYRAFVESCGLQPRILDLATGASSADPVSLEGTSAEIRGLFESCQMPSEIQLAIVQAYRALGSEQSSEMNQAAVAVRSSATAEDLPGLAFAGQQDTFLNVIGEQQVTEAVKKCWSSLWTSRAMAYRARNGITPGEVALAVVVQTMILAESAGVLFTANPLSGRRDEIVMDASYGLGEAVVSGQVEPDHFVVDSVGWRIVERHIGAKAMAILPAEGGGTRKVTREGSGQALPDARILDLARTAQKIATNFGSPQDIEWAVQGGQTFILQSRPITSLYPLPLNPFSDPGVRIYFALSSIQGFTDPFTPLGAHVLQNMVAGGVISLLRVRASALDYLTLAGRRLYLDLTDLARDSRLRNIVMGLLARGDPGALATFRRLVKEGRIPVRPGLTKRRALHVASAVRPIIFPGLRGLQDPEQVRVRATGELEKIVITEREKIGKATDLASILDVIEREAPHVFESILRAGIPVMLPSMAGLSIIDEWLKHWLRERPGVVLGLMRGLSHNVTTEMDLGLWHAAETMRVDPESVQVLQGYSLDALADLFHERKLPVIAQQEIDRFLRAYGMRSIAEIDLGRERWREDPTPILSVLIGYLSLTDPEQAPDAVFARGKKHADALADELVRRVRKTRFGALRARMLKAAIYRMRTVGGLRELPKFTIVRVLDLYRAALAGQGRRMQEQGVLDRADDIFFVPFDDLKSFAAGTSLDLKARVAANRAEYDRECSRRRFPRLLLSTGEAFYEGVIDESSGAAFLRGDPVSPGVAEGRARVVSDPRGVRLEPGEILVCTATDPGWTPLFLTAGGLVMEIGGVVTHGSVVAREYGIPAIVGVHDATTRLQTGQMVRVDGNEGRVTILEEG